jgi:hypothetical protein
MLISKQAITEDAATHIGYEGRCSAEGDQPILAMVGLKEIEFGRGKGQ